MLTQGPTSSVQLKYIQFNSIPSIQFFIFNMLDKQSRGQLQGQHRKQKKLRQITNRKRKHLKRGNIYKRHRQNCNNNNNKQIVRKLELEI